MMYQARWAIGLLGTVALAITASTASAQTQGTQIRVPLNSRNLSCEIRQERGGYGGDFTYRSIQLELTTALPGARLAHSVAYESSQTLDCSVKADLLALAASSDGTVPAVLTVDYHESRGGHVSESARLELPFGVTLHSYKYGTR